MVWWCHPGMLWTPGPPQPPVWVSVALPSTERQGRAQVAPGETRKQVGRYRGDPANEVGGSDHSLRAWTEVLVGGQLASAWLTPYQARPGPKSRRAVWELHLPRTQVDDGSAFCQEARGGPGAPWSVARGLSQQPGSLGHPAPGGGLACTPHDSPLEPTQNHFLAARELILCLLKAGTVGVRSGPSRDCVRCSGQSDPVQAG